MARLRDHETYGKSVKCVTIAPYVKGEGPTFTLHLFDTGRKEDGLTVVAYELWQRDPDGKRTGLINGEDFLSADPKHDSAVAALVNKLVVPPDNFDPSKDKVITEFYQEHAGPVNENARMRFAPRNVKLSRVASAKPSTKDAEPAPQKRRKTGKLYPGSNRFPEFYGGKTFAEVMTGRRNGGESATEDEVREFGQGMTKDQYDEARIAQSEKTGKLYPASERFPKFYGGKTFAEVMTGRRRGGEVASEDEVREFGQGMTKDQYDEARIAQSDSKSSSKSSSSSTATSDPGAVVSAHTAQYSAASLETAHVAVA